MSLVTPEDLLVEQESSIATITFNRPAARNAMTWEMYDRLYDELERLDQDRDIRVVIFRGAGEKAFVSGTDISQFLEFSTEQHALDYERRNGRVLGRIVELTKPTIAMVQGDAVGGGLFAALACDFRLAAPHARFGIPVARTLGNFPNPTNLARLFACIGIDRSREMLLSARLLSAEEACGIGLVHSVHPMSELEQKVHERARQLLELAPLTLAGVKEAARRVTEAYAIPNSDEILLSCYMSQDFQEGVRAFLDKRKPAWQGV